MKENIHVLIDNRIHTETTSYNLQNQLIIIKLVDF